MAQIMSAITQKGGTGKTTTVLNLAHALALNKKRVLIIDMDAQAHLSRTLDAEGPGLLDAITGGNGMGKLIRPTNMDRVAIIPASDELVDADLELVNIEGRETALARCLDAPITDAFDFILIDTPPSLSLLTINAILASDWLLVPLWPDFLPLASMKLLENTLDKVRHGVPTARFQVIGYLLTMYDRRERAMREEVEAIMADRYGKKVFPQPIRVNSDIKRAFAHGQSVIAYDRGRGRGSEDFHALASEVLKRVKAH